MGVYLIKASAPGPFKDYKKAMGAPPQSIFSVAAATPDDVDVELCDETIGMRPKLNTKADIVALLFHTPDAPHAHGLADTYRAKGRTVVLGGLHASFMPDEAASHADAVLIGEAEGVWEDLLRDQKNGQLKARCQRQIPVDLATVKPYPTDLIPPSKHDWVWSVLVSRGCPNRCEFRTVPPFFQGNYRFRPVEDIVAEIKALPKGCWVELYADELCGNRKYALELFRGLKPLGVNWVGEATIKLADDDELLQAAADSGCKGLLIGIEIPSQAALRGSGKGFVETAGVEERIRRFHSHGISITSSMIFGSDMHTPGSSEENAEYCSKIGIDEVEAVILIPFPGTPLFARLEDEGRILTEDWSQYDGSRVVFRPAKMTEEELSNGADWFWKEMYRKSSAPAFGKRPGADGAGGGGMGGPRLTTAPGGHIRWKSILALLLVDRLEVVRHDREGEHRLGRHARAPAREWRHEQRVPGLPVHSRQRGRLAHSPIGVLGAPLLLRQAPAVLILLERAQDLRTRLAQFHRLRDQFGQHCHRSRQKQVVVERGKVYIRLVHGALLPVLDSSIASSSSACYGQFPRPFLHPLSRSKMARGFSRHVLRYFYIAFWSRSLILSEIHAVCIE